MRDESDILLDIVQNRPVSNEDSVCLSDNNEPPLSRLSPVTLDAELPNNDQPELTGPLTLDKFTEAAVSAAIEELTNIKPVNELVISNNERSMTTNETSNVIKEQSVSVRNEPEPEATPILSVETTGEMETLSSLPLTGEDNGDINVLQTMASAQGTHNMTTLGESLEQKGVLLGVTVPSNDVSSGPS